jgi:GNAT superfamily N-acetyltransferase
MMREVAGIRERLLNAGIGLKDTLAVMDMTLEDEVEGLEKRSPQELFEGLNGLIHRTVHGTTVERFRPARGGHPFHTFEIHTDDGDVLGYLNMMYFRKPIPCYYLVYVEVLPPFRGRGLGNKILAALREFVEIKGALGLLDNIIPEEEPTYGIYAKLGWKDTRETLGQEVVKEEGNYMVFVPASMKANDLKEKLPKLLFNLKKKRPVIDMHDNEAMVKRTIDEFRAVYSALVRVFGKELAAGTSTPIMRFMFTNFVTKLLGFRRRISLLLGYTGGESLDQIVISDEVGALPIHPHSLWGRSAEGPSMWGDSGLIERFPARLKKNPTAFIEGLSVYMRPYVSSWLERSGRASPLDLRISDLLELGFLPTKLREWCHEGERFIFERVSLGFLNSVERRREYFPKIAQDAFGRRFRGAELQVNPPLVTIRDKGNVYVVRRKVEGIHSEEALDQLRSSPHLREMNRATGIDRAVVSTLGEIRGWLVAVLEPALRDEIEEVAFFIPWDLERNYPKVSVDVTGVSIQTAWIA